MNTRNLALLLSALSAVLCADLRSQSCTLVHDINRVASNFSSNVSNARAPLPGYHRVAGFAKLGSYWYFTATTLAHGQELWRSDGTVAGTARVTDLNPGNADSRITQISVFDLGSGPRLWFSATNGSTGLELWSSDGTSRGTALVKDINPGPSSGTPHSMVQLGNRILFGADGGTNGFELWSTDGSSAGTAEVKDIYPGSPSSGAGLLITSTNGRTVFFRADDGSNGYELWKTDGSSRGTVLVRDIQPGSGSSFPDYLSNVGGVVVFRARGPSGSELYRSDGTTAGTTILKDIYPGSRGSSPDLFDLAVVGSNLYFVASDPTAGRELWRTDGSAAGTRLVADIRPGSSSSSPNRLTVLGSRIFLAANSGKGNEPHVYDGNKVVSLGDLYPGPFGYGAYAWVQISAGRWLFSSGNGSTYGLYTTDGTANGTKRYYTFQQTNPRGPAFNATRVGNLVLFTVLDATHGIELWTTAGTAATTRMLLDVEPGTVTADSHVFWNSGKDARRAVDGSKLYMSADDGKSGRELWLLENDKIRQVRDIRPGVQSSDPLNFHSFFDGVSTRTVFVANDGVHGLEPWITDGSTAGTALLADIQPGSRGSRGSFSSHEFATLGPRVLFSANTSTSGTELWVTNGTRSGTRMVKDIYPGSRGLCRNFHVYKGRLWFSASDGVQGEELWVSDGTAKGTVLFKDIWPGRFSSVPDQFAEHDGKLYFTAYTPATGTELWVTDGTANGTRLVLDIWPGAAGSRPRELTSCNGRLFFAANGGSAGEELWITDGTVAGTRSVDLRAGSASSQPRDLYCSANTLYFAAIARHPNGRVVYSPHRSDGTVAGTKRIPGIFAGPDFSPLAAGNGGIYFTGATDDGGSVYYTDAKGTVAVCDLTQHGSRASPTSLTYVDDHLVFIASSRAVGREVHRLSAPARGHVMRYGSACRPALGTLRSTDPLLNSTTVLSGTSPPAVPGVVLLGLPQAAGPLPLSAPCALHIDLRVPPLPLAAFTGPRWSTRLPIPNDSSLAGVHVAVQAFYIYISPILASSSNAVRLVIGR